MHNIFCGGAIALSPIPGGPLVKDYFVRRGILDDDAGIKINFIGKNFIEWFWEKEEPPMKETELWYFTVIRFVRDVVAIGMLGGGKAEAMIAEMCAAIKKCETAKMRGSLGDGCRNVIFARDKNKKLRKVFFKRRGEGWDIDARKSSRLRWLTYKCRVLSHELP
jgi:hypothetical protein